VHKVALGPLMDDKISVAEALDRAEKPLGEWMIKHTKEDDLALFYDIAGRPRPARGEAIAFSALVPAFMISELNTAFKMGLYVFIPMLLIDLLVGHHPDVAGHDDGAAPADRAAAEAGHLPPRRGLAPGRLLAGEELLNGRPIFLSSAAFVRASGCWPSVGAPFLGVLLVVGLVFGVIQAATQNQRLHPGLPAQAGGRHRVSWMFGGWAVERLAQYLIVCFNRMSQHI
jgi:flagellar biosynthesis protein FliQ